MRSRRPHKLPILALMVPLSLPGIVVWAASPADESLEPPVTYTLTLGGQKVDLLEGRPVTISGSFSNPVAVLEASTSRIFPHAGISFAFPRSFTFEADLEDADSKSWTLSGNDFKIMVFSLANLSSAKSYVEGVAEVLAGDEIVREKAALKLPNPNLGRAAVRFEMVGNPMRFEAYELPSLGKRKRLLVLQDSPPEGKTSSAEALMARAMLESTFRLTEK